MEVTYFVYLLTFANGKVYVGMSRTDAKGLYTGRYRDHARTAKYGKASPIYNAWRKHGAPTQTIVSTHATREDCALAEINTIQVHDSMNPERGYNLQPGGQGLHAPPGSAVYELMRAKVWNNPERRRKSSEALKGKPLPQSVQDAHREWRESDVGRAKTAELTKRPEVRAKMSAAMLKRLANGYREYLSEVQIGKPRSLSPEGKARALAAQKAWSGRPENREKARATLTESRANPEFEAKRLAAIAVHANSDANRAHCAAMAAKASKPVKDLATGQIYESRAAAARALGVSGPTIGYWVKKGKFEYT
jgi:hypothetical protein